MKYIKIIIIILIILIYLLVKLQNEGFTCTDPSNVVQISYMDQGIDASLCLNVGSNYTYQLANNSKCNIELLPGISAILYNDYDSTNNSNIPSKTITTDTTLYASCNPNYITVT